MRTHRNDDVRAIAIPRDDFEPLDRLGVPDDVVERLGAVLRAQKGCCRGVKGRRGGEGWSREKGGTGQRGCRPKQQPSLRKHTFSTLSTQHTSVVSARLSTPRRNETREGEGAPGQLVLDGLVLLWLFALVSGRRRRELQLLVHDERVAGRMSRRAMRTRGLASATTQLVSRNASNGCCIVLTKLAARSQSRQSDSRSCSPRSSISILIAPSRPPFHPHSGTAGTGTRSSGPSQQPPSSTTQSRASALTRLPLHPRLPINLPQLA